MILQGEDNIMDNDLYQNVGKNIKTLRKSHGETIVDLAFSIGINSPSAITNYEKGTSIPQRDILIKIANHYRITVDELINEQIPFVDIKALPLKDQDKMKEIAGTILPIVSSENAMQNSDFKKGYTIHKEIYRKICLGIEYTETEFMSCFGAYMSAYENSDVPEAMANLIWWFLFFGVGLSERKMIEGYKDLNSYDISNQIFIRDFYLNDCDEEFIGEDELFQKEKDVYLNETGECVQNY